LNEKHNFTIAVIIITTVCIILIGTLFKSVITGEHVSEHGKDLLADIVNSIIVIVSMIIGNRSGSNGCK